MRILSPAINLFFERLVRSQSLDQIADSMAASGQKLELLFGATGDSDHNRRVVSHIVGIERWGQRRLRAALGEPLVIDEYDDYRPPRVATLPELQVDFVATRQDTVALAHDLAAANVGSVQIPHNQWGNLSVRGWLSYLDFHASQEARKLK
ncbi:MAG: hypothetical protein H6649_02790 [Caldilineae bacterium]|nr:hypothetical protein [Caldilineae bacterium]